MAGKPTYEELERRVKELEKESAELKHTKTELRESEKRFRTVVEKSVEAIFLINFDMEFAYWNPAADKLIGLTAQLSTRITLPDVLTPDSLEVAIANIAHAAKTGTTQPSPYELTIRKMDGTMADIEVFIGLVEYDGKPHMLGTARDITERRRIEEALQESEERYRLFAESMTDLMWIMDMNLRLTYINPYGAQWTGYSAEEAIGKTLGEFITPVSLEVVGRAFAEEMAIEEMEGKDLKRLLIFELEHICKDGSTIWAEAKATFLRDSDGQPVGILGVTRDITERKRAEEEKRKLETQLQKARKMEAIGTLAGGIAHDFNNLLTGIHGRASLMLKDIDYEHPHFENLREIEGMVRSGADLTAQLLGFARGGKYEVRPTDLNDLIEKSSRMFGRTKKEINIHGKYQAGIWAVEVDRGQIEQVLLNLYVNAWQAMPGGGELYLQTENVTLDEVYVMSFNVEAGDYVKVSVTDTGVGMDEETSRRVFDPFFTTREMGRGTGLGLASSYGIIRNHGGIIKVSSEEGSGATFNIYLPVSEKEVAEDKKLPDEAAIKSGTETILFVDDEEMVIDVGRDMLRAMGYSVLVAGGGREAVEIYRENMASIGMVILDMIMPDMGGGKTYDRLKKINPDVKVLLASGYSIDGQATEILKRGCNGFIQKPFSIKNMSQKIREILDGE